MAARRAIVSAHPSTYRCSASPRAGVVPATRRGTRPRRRGDRPGALVTGVLVTGVLVTGVRQGAPSAHCMRSEAERAGTHQAACACKGAQHRAAAVAASRPWQLRRPAALSTPGASVAGVASQVDASRPELAVTATIPSGRPGGRPLPTAQASHSPRPHRAPTPAARCRAAMTLRAPSPCRAVADSARRRREPLQG
jgi:hypothetical protein